MPPKTELLDAPDGRILRITGPLLVADLAAVWTPILDAARGAHVIDLEGVPACDTAGGTLLLTAERESGAVLSKAPPHLASLLERLRRAVPTSDLPARHDGGESVSPVARAEDVLAFTGETAVAIARSGQHTRMFSLRNFLALIDAAGLQAIPLVMLLGYLIGLILAFQSSIALRPYGAEIFIANLVVIALLRELGPLLAAIILAGRTSSAYAAELGTMVVNDEVAALRTMALDPVTVLVLPRIAAAALVMPGLTLLFDLAGIIGMVTVMKTLGFPVVAVLHQVRAAAQMKDLLTGLFKSILFGLAVAATGCRTGLAARLGPRAVGEAATRAVVGSIIASIVIDGAVTVLFFRLGV